MIRGWSRHVVLGTASVGLVVLSGCGTSEHIADHATTSISPSSPSVTTPSGVTPSATPPSTSPAPATAPSQTPTQTQEVNPNRLQGEVYSLLMPQGWTDDTKVMQRETPVIDLAIGRELPSGGYLSLTVFDTGEILLPSQVGSPAYRETLVNQLGSATHTAVTPVPTIRIDRQVALGIKTTGSFLGKNASFTIYLPSRYNQLYTVVLATSPGDEALGAPVFARILTSWDWV